MYRSELSSLACTPYVHAPRSRKKPAASCDPFVGRWKCERLETMRFGELVRLNPGVLTPMNKFTRLRDLCCSMDNALPDSIMFLTGLTSLDITWMFGANKGFPHPCLLFTFACTTQQLMLTGGNFRPALNSERCAGFAALSLQPSGQGCCCHSRKASILCKVAFPLLCTGCSHILLISCNLEVFAWMATVLSMHTSHSTLGYLSLGALC